MAKAIMIQGTMSNVGKSFLTAGLCRILKEEGYRVAPFKSQNMALNSYITQDGLEMGRAQAMQAEAAGVKPQVCMNPILLKPTTDVGSQVIVNGRPVGTMRAAQYYAYKKQLHATVLEAFHTLQTQYDVIVVEGAGSPVELNLKQDDFVNMGLARELQIPVLLVGDIDRGGVFAQLIGTCDLLEPEERTLVKGLLVNKFRGDADLFADGVRILEEKSRLPVLGVVPYMHVDIEDEDSLSEKLLVQHTIGDNDARYVQIAVIRLPRISNFTDFDVFSQYKSVNVRYAVRPEELEGADLIIVPGTKSTITDMLWMRQNGLEAAIKKKVAEQVPVFGICGGFQMLGEAIRDPHGMEGGGSIAGMGLLQTQTVFAKEKETRQVSGRIGTLDGIFSSLSGMQMHGYEIHMGRTELVFAEDSPVQEEAGWILNQKNVYGTYVHGIFDAEGIADEVLAQLGRRKGMVWQRGMLSREAYKQLQYTKLADQLRAHMNLPEICAILNGDR